MQTPQKNKSAYPGLQALAISSALFIIWAIIRLFELSAQFVPAPPMNVQVITLSAIIGLILILMLVLPLVFDPSILAKWLDEGNTIITPPPAKKPVKSNVKKNWPKEEVIQ